MEGRHDGDIKIEDFGKEKNLRHSSQVTSEKCIFRSPQNLE